jgi:hypothetical protein
MGSEHEYLINITSLKIKVTHNPHLTLKKMHVHHQKDTYIKET